MVEIYEDKGLPQEQAREVVAYMAKFPKFFVGVMMMEELQMPPPSKLGCWATALSLALGCCGSGLALLLVHYCVDSAVTSQAAAAILCVVAAAALASLGALRASCSHQATVRLALKTGFLALPCALFARLGGSQLAHLGTFNVT